jgi:phage terminase large subunit-like protein
MTNKTLGSTDKIESPYFDEKGIEIKEFALIKIFHFKGVNSKGNGRKNYFMYKWVKLIKDAKGKEWWVALHLNNDNNDYYHLRTVADKDTRIINGTEIIQQTNR